MKDGFVNIIQHKVRAVLIYFYDVSNYFLELESGQSNLLYFWQKN